jgi:hypothetical protein
MSVACLCPWPLHAAEEAAHMMNNLDFQGAVKEVGEAAQYLKDTG